MVGIRLPTLEVRIYGEFRGEGQNDSCGWSWRHPEELMFSFIWLHMVIHVCITYMCVYVNIHTCISLLSAERAQEKQYPISNQKNWRLGDMSPCKKDINKCFNELASGGETNPPEEEFQTIYGDPPPSRRQSKTQDSRDELRAMVYELHSREDRVKRGKKRDVCSGDT